MLRPEQDGWKLIRHKMPELVWKRDGRRMMTRPVEGEEHVRYLRWKFDEEANEVVAATIRRLAGELADVRQTLRDFCTLANIAVGDLRVEPFEKLRERVPKGPKARVIADLAEALRGHADAFARGNEDADTCIVEEALETVGLLTAAANIREDVRMELAWKLEERGGFIPGILWKVPEKPLS